MPDTPIQLINGHLLDMHLAISFVSPKIYAIAQHCRMNYTYMSTDQSRKLIMHGHLSSIDTCSLHAYDKLFGITSRNHKERCNLQF